MISTLFIYLFIAPFIHFVDATAAAKFVSVNSSPTEVERHFFEKDYVSIMTNEVNDQRYLRGRKLQENIDYQKKPYYQSQQQAQGAASRGQLITLAVVVTLTVALAVYSAFLYREYAVITLYNVLGYRVFDDSQVQGEDEEGVEIG